MDWAPIASRERMAFYVFEGGTRPYGYRYFPAHQNVRTTCPLDRPGTDAMHDHELNFLRRCVDLAEQAVEAGDQPFGSLLVSEHAEILFEDRNRTGGGDSTRHPEFAIARWAARNLSAEERRAATVYTSGEHCAMCAAAHGLVGLGRIVFATSTEQLLEWKRELGHEPLGIRPLRIREVLPEADMSGPFLQFADEVRAMHAKAGK